VAAVVTANWLGLVPDIVQILALPRLGEFIIGGGIAVTNNAHYPQVMLFDISTLESAAANQSILTTRTSNGLCVFAENYPIFIILDKPSNITKIWGGNFGDQVLSISAPVIFDVDDDAVADRWMVRNSHTLDLGSYRFLPGNPSKYDLFFDLRLPARLVKAPDVVDMCTLVARRLIATADATSEIVFGTSTVAVRTLTQLPWVIDQASWKAAQPRLFEKMVASSSVFDATGWGD
jgi:hypothetical protein